MGLDHSKAIVRIAFDGLIIFCFNRTKTLCEVGMIRNGGHHRDLKITEILPSGHRRPIKLKDYDIDPSKDLEISAVNPLPPHTPPLPSDTPLSGYQDTEDFDRVNDKGDPEDFRWIVDLEGAEFHRKRLNPKRDGFKSKLTLTHGIFYTVRKTRRHYGRLTLGGPDDLRFLGKLAHNVGVDIQIRDDDGKVIIKNRGAASGLELPRPLPEGERDVLGCTYEIIVENACEPNPRTSDFPLFYGAVSDPGGVQYDLRIAVPPGHSLGGGPPFPNKSSFRKDGEPQVCQTGFLSASETLGF
jgi:hypothetical protein